MRKIGSSFGHAASMWNQREHMEKCTLGRAILGPAMKTLHISSRNLRTQLMASKLAYVCWGENGDVMFPSSRAAVPLTPRV
jgi:hypothetical protein